VRIFTSVEASGWSVAVGVCGMLHPPPGETRPAVVIETETGRGTETQTERGQARLDVTETRPRKLSHEIKSHELKSHGLKSHELKSHELKSHELKNHALRARLWSIGHTRTRTHVRVTAHGAWGMRLTGETESDVRESEVLQTDLLLG